MIAARIEFAFVGDEESRMFTYQAYANAPFFGVAVKTALLLPLPVVNTFEARLTMDVPQLIVVVEPSAFVRT